MVGLPDQIPCGSSESRGAQDGVEDVLEQGLPVVEDESAGAGDGGGWVETVDEA